MWLSWNKYIINGTDITEEDKIPIVIWIVLYTFNIDCCWPNKMVVESCCCCYFWTTNCLHVSVGSLNKYICLFDILVLKWAMCRKAILHTKQIQVYTTHTQKYSNHKCLNKIKRNTHTHIYIHLNKRLTKGKKISSIMTIFYATTYSFIHSFNRIQTQHDLILVYRSIRRKERPEDYHFAWHTKWTI